MNIIDYLGQVAPQDGQRCTSPEEEELLRRMREIAQRNSITMLMPERKCLFESLRPEDRMKPMGLSCPCPKCTPYSLG